MKGLGYSLLGLLISVIIIAIFVGLYYFMVVIGFILAIIGIALIILFLIGSGIYYGGKKLFKRKNKGHVGKKRNII